jgi:hypothetical protein
MIKLIMRQTSGSTPEQNLPSIIGDRDRIVVDVVMEAAHPHPHIMNSVIPRVDSTTRLLWRLEYSVVG